MKHLILLSISLLIFGTSKAQLDTLSLDSAQWVSAANLGNCDDLSRYDGKKVVVEGVCVVDGALYGSSSHNIHVSMSSNPSPFGSIRLRQGDPNAQYSVSIRNLKQGDSVRIVGTLSQYQGETQLEPETTNDAITLYKRNVAISDTVLTVGTFNDGSKNNNLATGEQWESSFVTFEDVDVVEVSPFSGNRVSFTIQDKAGNQINIGDHFTAQRTPAYTHPVTSLPGTFSAPTIGDNFKSISGMIIHSKNNCAGETGRGYELHPFDASQYVYGPSAPKISNKKRDQLAPTAVQSAVITANIRDLDGTITDASVFYNTGTDISDLNFTKIAMTKGTGDSYSASIPAQANGTFVRYYVTATDDSLNTTTIPNSNPAAASFAYRVRDNGLTIYDLQFTPFPNGNSIFVGNEVTVTGVVTASGAEGDLSIIHIQEENAISGWSGIELQNAGTTFERGDKLSVTGSVLEDFGKTALSVTNVAKSGTGTIDPLFLIPDSLVSYSFAGNERYESVLIGLHNPNGKLHVVDTNADDPASFAEWLVGRDKNDPANGARILTGREFESSTAVSYVNSSFRVKAPYPVEKIIVTDTVEMDSVIGILTYSFSNMKLLPRDNDDFKNINLVVTSIKTYSNDVEISIFPNPSNDVITVNADGNEYSVSIVDLSGKIVVNTSINQSSNAVNISELDNGIYILSLSNLNGETVAREKVIIKH
ncbi:MAG: T9SS type A sorting domain-containing protein [Salibacteraceae bacterium]|nr:T9SS type A sorting domain-containing protein [Salibacteraceae bacterium]|tara:strand:+ start:95374 stop:97488 length:2115 start_codon:yes stop_codon:yes gene_type:complete